MTGEMYDNQNMMTMEMTVEFVTAAMSPSTIHMLSCNSVVISRGLIASRAL